MVSQISYVSALQPETHTVAHLVYVAYVAYVYMLKPRGAHGVRCVSFNMQDDADTFQRIERSASRRSRMKTFHDAV